MVKGLLQSRVCFRSGKLFATGMQSKTLLAKIDAADLRRDDFGWWRDEALLALGELC